jgi:hypothetical protein
VITGDLVEPITEPWEIDDEFFPHGTPKREAIEAQKEADRIAAGAPVQGESTSAAAERDR